MRTPKRILILMKNNQKIFINCAGNIKPAEVYKSITDLLRATRERDERIMVNGFELSNMMLSELKSISNELKLISQNLRRLS